MSTFFTHLDGDTEYEVSVTWVRIIDDNYGADADGNRGTTMVFAEDMDFQVDLDGKNVTNTLSSELLARIEKQAAKEVW